MGDGACFVDVVVLFRRRSLLSRETWVKCAVLLM